MQTACRLQRQQLNSGLESVHSNVDVDAPVFEPLVPVGLLVTDLMRLNARSHRRTSFAVDF